MTKISAFEQDDCAVAPPPLLPRYLLPRDMGNTTHSSALLLSLSHIRRELIFCLKFAPPQSYYHMFNYRSTEDFYLTMKLILCLSGQRELSNSGFHKDLTTHLDLGTLEMAFLLENITSRWNSIYCTRYT